MRLRTMLVSRALPTMLFGATLGCSSGPQPRVVNPTTVGDLPGPVATLTGDDLWKLGRSLGWVHGRTQDRTCAQGSCRARMDAVRDQEEPGPTRIGTYGTIVARFVNRGGPLGGDRGPEARYGFDKSDATEYYLIAVPNSSEPSGWSWIVRVAFPGDQGTLPMRIGSWVVCDSDQYNPDHPPSGTKSEFYKCVPPPSPPNGQAMARLLYNPLDPGWLDCDQGCCSAGQ